jgi:hypothetical protein
MDLGFRADSTAALGLLSYPEAESGIPSAAMENVRVMPSGLAPRPTPGVGGELGDAYTADEGSP